VRLAPFSFLGLLAGASASCARSKAEPPLYTVDQLVPQIEELNGRTVRVVGYLGDCAGDSCDLYPREADVAVWKRAFAEIREKKQFHDPGLSVLGIGPGKIDDDGFEFDRKAAPFNRTYVVITGTVDSRCRYKGERGCTDRSPDLQPTSISPWRGSSPQDPFHDKGTK